MIKRIYIPWTCLLLRISSQPEMIKAVAITYQGSLVLRDDVLYDVLVDNAQPSDSIDRDRTIVVVVKGASDYLPAKAGECKCTAGRLWVFAFHFHA